LERLDREAVTPNRFWHKADMADRPLMSVYGCQLNRSMRTLAEDPKMSANDRLCCKNRFAPKIKNSKGRRRGFRVKM
jgi:hypothetical protein